MWCFLFVVLNLAGLNFVERNFCFRGDCLVRARSVPKTTEKVCDRCLESQLSVFSHPSLVRLAAMAPVSFTCSIDFVRGPSRESFLSFM